MSDLLAGQWARFTTTPTKPIGRKWYYAGDIVKVEMVHEDEVYFGAPLINTPASRLRRIHVPGGPEEQKVFGALVDQAKTPASDWISIQTLIGITGLPQDQVTRILEFYRSKGMAKRKVAPHCWSLIQAGIRWHDEVYDLRGDVSSRDAPTEMPHHSLRPGNWAKFVTLPPDPIRFRGGDIIRVDRVDGDHVYFGTPQLVTTASRLRRIYVPGDREEQKVFGALVHQAQNAGSQWITRQDLARNTDLPQEKVASILQFYRSKGLVSFYPPSPSCWSLLTWAIRWHDQVDDETSPPKEKTMAAHSLRPGHWARFRDLPPETIKHPCGRGWLSTGDLVQVQRVEGDRIYFGPDFYTIALRLRRVHVPGDKEERRVFRALVNQEHSPSPPWRTSSDLAKATGLPPYRVVKILEFYRSKGLVAPSYGPPVSWHLTPSKLQWHDARDPDPTPKDHDMLDSITKSMFREVKDIVWDLQTGRLGILQDKAIYSLETVGKKVRVAKNPIREFGVKIPAYALLTPVESIRPGDIVILDDDRRVFFLSSHAANATEELSFKGLDTRTGRQSTFTVVANSLLGTRGVLVVKNPIGDSPNLAGMLPFLLMSGGQEHDVGQMIALMTLAANKAPADGNPPAPDLNSLLPLLLLGKKGGNKKHLLLLTMLQGQGNLAGMLPFLLMNQETNQDQDQDEEEEDEDEEDE